MKRAIIVKNFDAGWGIQNRVEALSDWSRDGLTPFEIDIIGNNALITVDDKKKASYESEYQWEQDIATLDGIIKDIQDPLFAEDGQTYREINMESSSKDAIDNFTTFAINNCSELGYEMLRVMGLKMPEKPEEEVSVESNVSRVAELEAMAKTIDLTGLESVVPEEPVVTEEPEVAEAISEVTDVEPTPEPTPEPTATVTPEPVKPAEGIFVDPRKEFIDEFMEACKEYDITPKGLVACIMSIKALANSSAKISVESMSVDDYTTLKSRQYPKSFARQKVTTTKQAKKLYKDIEKLHTPMGIDLGEKDTAFVKSEKAIYIGDMYGSAAFLLPDGTVGFIDSEVDKGGFYKTSTIEKDLKEANISADDVTGKEDYSYTNAIPYPENPNDKDDEDVIDVQGMNVAGGVPNTEVGTESLLNVFSSKRKNTITKEKLDALIDTIDSRIKMVLPKYQGVLDSIKEDAMILDGYKNGFKVNYRMERLNNKVRFSIIDMDHAKLLKANVGTFLLNMFAYSLASLGNAPVVYLAPNSLDLRSNFKWVDLQVLTKPIIKELNTYCTGYEYGKLDKYTLGIEIKYKLADSIGTESIDAENVYDSLVNDLEDTNPFTVEDDNEMFLDPDQGSISTEAFLFSKGQPNDNEVLRDIKKIIEDAKKISKKAWNELREKNSDIFEKYGAFIKILLDIKDIIFMDKRNINLEIVTFNSKKANNEIVPDNTEEVIMKQISGAVVKSAFGPFASLAKGEDKPGQVLLALANKLRKDIISELKPTIPDYLHPSIEIDEDEISGQRSLCLKFKNVPKNITLESATEDTTVGTEEVVENLSLIEKLAKESNNDDEFFSKVVDHKNDIDYVTAMECVNNNMYTYYKTGEKHPVDRAVSSKRILAYIKK